MYCVRCLSARNLLPSPQQTPTLGVLGLFYKPSNPLGWTAPVAYPTRECSPSGQCWLSAIYPLARMTSGNRNFELRLSRVASVLYEKGRLTKQMLVDLEVYDRGCKWYPITGPCPGVAVYANRMHVSDEPFLGASHVLTNLPLPQNPCRPGFCPFESAQAKIYTLYGKTIFISDEGYMWTRGVDSSAQTPFGEDRLLCRRILTTLPADHTVKCTLEVFREEYSFTNGHGNGHLRVGRCNGTPYGLCWAKIFESRSWDLACVEVSKAERLGYQLPYGVAGKYIARRLQVTGLKAVVKPAMNDFIVWAFADANSYIRHITERDEPVEDFFVKVGEFSICENTEIVRFPKFNFGSNKYYGYSPPGDGGCGLHCISAVVNDMEGKGLKSSLGECARDSNFWLSDDNLYHIIMSMHLPVSMGYCPLASYKLNCPSNHWTVDKIKKTKPYGGLAPECVRGVCGGTCKPVPTIPIMLDLSGVKDVAPDLIYYHLGVEPYNDEWSLAASLRVGDDLSKAIACADEVARQHLKVSEEDWDALRDCMLEGCTSRHQVYETLAGCVRSKSKVSDTQSPDNETDDEDFSVPGLLIAGSDSIASLANDCHMECFKALGTTRSQASTPTSELAASMFTELMQPAENSLSKEETKLIIETAISSLKTAQLANFKPFPVPAPRRSLALAAGPCSLSADNLMKPEEVKPDQVSQSAPLRASSTGFLNTMVFEASQHKTPPVPAPRTKPGLKRSLANMATTSVDDVFVPVETPLNQQPPPVPAPRKLVPTALINNSHCRPPVGAGESTVQESCDEGSKTHMQPKQPPCGEEKKTRQFSFETLTWNPNEVGVKLVCIQEDIRDFTKKLIPAGFKITRGALTKELLTQLKSLKSSDPTDVLTKAEDFAKNLDRALLSPRARAIHGLTDDELVKRLKAALPFPRSCGVGDFLTKAHEKAGLEEYAVPLAQPKQPGKCKTKSEEDLQAAIKKVVQPTSSPKQIVSPPGHEGTPDKKTEQTTPQAKYQPVDTTVRWNDRARKKGSDFINWLNRQVFVVVSHLQAAIAVTLHARCVLGPADYMYSLFCLLCVFCCFYYPMFGVLPLAGCVIGNGWITRISVFSVWLCIAVVVFQEVLPEPGAVCTSATPDCADALRDYTAAGLHRPISSVSLGVCGTFMGILAKLVGGPRYIWNLCLRLLVVLDIGLVFVAMVLRGRCKRCLGKCVRVAPVEVALKVFPVSKVARSTLIDLCDKYTQPNVDPIKLATGYSGCYSGKHDPHQCSDKPVAYGHIEEKKITNKTVVPPPLDPQSAVKCLRVLQAGGGIQKLDIPEVKKVSQVPFKAPFFPDVKVDPDCYVVVDAETYSAALRGGHSTKQLIVGIGDFAAINGVKFIKGGALIDYVLIGVYVLVNFLINAWITAPVTCGIGTNDPWCRNPFSYPIYGSGVMCNTHLCVSENGITAPFLSAFSFVDWALGVAIIATVVVLSLKWVVFVDVVIIFVALVMYVFPVLSHAAFVFPFILLKVSIHPVTLIWLHFFIVTINPLAGLCSVCILVMSWVLAKLTGVCGLITPYDVHSVASGLRNSTALQSAPEGTFLAAVRRAALTGRCVMFTPSQFGSILEGSLRTQKTPDNVVTVFGSSSGTGSVFTIRGNPTVITASHLLKDGEGRVSCVGFSECIKFDVKGDFASARLPTWKGPAPKAEFTEKTGRAFWLTASGVEPGFVGETSALCFTHCGDSGSAVVDGKGNIYGVHTGSNKKGSGMITRPTGITIGMSSIKISELVPHFGGPSVPLLKVPPHVVKDVEVAPSDLVTVLESSPTPEGALSSVQVLCVFFFLWRMIHYPMVPFIALGFFVANELLPAVLMRLIFSYALSCVSLFTPYSIQACLIRLLTATLNRSLWSFWFYVFGAVVALSSNAFNLSDFGYCTWFFVPRVIAMNSPVHVGAIVACVHLLALVLSIFKKHSLTDVLVGNGSFDAAFFLKYFAEGNLRDGVAQSCGLSEGLTCALAVSLSDDDLAFLQKYTDCKCFISASNMRDGAGCFIESAYAKALRQELAATDRMKSSQGIMAKLEAFVSGKPVEVCPGDVVVVLGRVPIGDILTVTHGDKSHLVKVEETRCMAGTQFSVGIVTKEESFHENSPGQGGGFGKLRTKKGKVVKIQTLDHVEDVIIGGSKFSKMWNKDTGDILYKPYEEGSAPEFEGVLISENPKNETIGLSSAGHFQKFIRRHGKKISTGTKLLPLSGKKKVQVPIETYELDGVEYDVPANEPLEWEVTLYDDNLEAERLTVEQALRHMGHDTQLTQKEVEKLKRIVEKLNGLTQAAALNF